MRRFTQVSAFAWATPRFGPVRALWGLSFLAFSLLRLALIVTNARQLDWTAPSLAGAVLVGIAYDACVATVLTLPAAALLALAPRRWVSSGAWPLLASIVFAFGALFVYLDVLAEWLFWDEFAVRFNFIAIDYLVYTNEVIGDIRESYPIPRLLAGLAGLAAVSTWLQRRWAPRDGAGAPRGDRRARVVAGHAGLAAVLVWALSWTPQAAFTNVYVREIASNGLYELVRAFRDNELSYTRFYRTLPVAQVHAAARRKRSLSGWVPVNASPDDLRMRVQGKEPERRPNVILICMESMSADYMAAFGGRKGLTPTLDRLAADSLFFTRAFASGTRTVRGLEALALSVPPTPGNAIVRRPNNEGLFTMATVFAQKGYANHFVYGGYGYFDNMNDFFGDNGYAVSDRLAVPASRIHHETVWGIADEDLFTQVLRLADGDASAGRPFFMHVLTTSNHRPYSYPEGRIDIPSKSGRDGAVKYADWAIGDFLARARGRAWFSNTVFVIVADHQAASAGKTELPLARYHIPLMFYAPGLVSPGTIDRLIAQVDVAPTLFGTLGWSYTSKFFGHDINALPVGQEHALIGTYQRLGYIEGRTLVILEPDGEVKTEEIDWATLTSRPGPAPPGLVDDAVAFYQEASLAFHDGRLRAQDAAPARQASSGASRHTAGSAAAPP